MPFPQCGNGIFVRVVRPPPVRRLRANPKVSRGLEKLAGMFLIGFGIKLVVSR